MKKNIEIKTFYLHAKNAIEQNNIDKARKIIYEDMNVDLYDKSISLYLDRNLNLSESRNELIELITFVIKALD